MFLEAQPKQYSVKDDGRIFFQPDSTNPLPGEAVAQVGKGENLLQPSVALIDGVDLKGEDAVAVRDHIETWLKAHIYTVLEPLFALVTDETLEGAVKDIALKLFEYTGTVPRGEVDAMIAQLTPEARKILRDKKVRLGPLLVFLPDLNKPAAVHLRALLWSLYHDAPLPAPIPRDGAMSQVVDVTTANADFYRAIGYPLYGPRIIRIDMLDRVINAVYDSAKDGKFQAQHKMAEWMGCPIADLYAILTAMGHKRIETPVVVEQEVAVEAVVEVPAPVVAEATNEVQTEIVAETPAPKAEQKKPELDFFFLRRGKAHMEQAERRPREFTRTEKPAFPKERFEAKKPFHKKKDKNGEGEGGDRHSFKKKKRDDKHDKRDRKTANDEGRVYTAEAAVLDNPFAVLQGLKLK